MWKRLLARVHPDAGGDHETFIWAMNLRDTVCNGATVAPPKEEEARPQPPPPPPPRREPPPKSSAREPGATHRIPFDTSLSFTELTIKATAIAGDGEVLPLYADLLRLLADCEEAYIGTLRDQQEKGASYRQLAAIAHTVGMSKDRRIGWYRLAESIPLSVRHAGHILSRVKARKAA